MSDFDNIWQCGAAYEKALDSRKWMEKIPFLSFPEGFAVKPICNFSGAQARLLVQNVKNKKQVSIYFDTHNVLGCMSGPYWEIYPGTDGEPDRFYLGEEDDMIETIVAVLTKKEKK